jgi:hypothetical protein
MRSAPQQKKEKNIAFYLLDALSRSGNLTIDSAEMHVVIGTTHSFFESLIDTVIRENVNPIEAIRGTLMKVGAILYGCEEKDLDR